MEEHTVTCCRAQELEADLRNEPYAPSRGTRPTRIVAAAILQNGLVWTGRRHADLIRLVIEDDGDYVRQEHQGFWTDDGRFVNRQAAKSIAIRSEQIPETYRGTLISEDLW